VVRDDAAVVRDDAAVVRDDAAVVRMGRSRAAAKSFNIILRP